MRIGELIVAVMRERQIACAAIVEFFNACDVLAERIAVLDTDESDFFTLAWIRRTSAAVRASSILSGAISRVKRRTAVEFLNREFVSSLVPGRCERIRILRFSRLADVDAEEQRVEAAVDHIRQIELGFEPLL